MNYFKNVFGSGAIVLGAFFLIEHIYKWEELSFFDFIGHEWLGLALILFGVIINVNWSKGRLSIELKNLYSKLQGFVSQILNKAKEEQRKIEKKKDR